MKKIALIFNGGTITMKVDERIKAAVPTLSGEEIVAMITGIEEFAKIEIDTFSNLPGPHITPEKMLELSKYVQKVLDRKEIDGVVITHGTDTLEETAYFLDLTIKSHKPVVVTGSMRNSSELGYDGPANLSASICTAIADEANNRGVLVVLNGEVNCASEVTKTNTMSLDTFKSPEFGPIGIVDNNEALFFRNRINRHNIEIRSLETRVELIKCAAGMDTKFIDYCIEKGSRGIVIEALGRGNLPPQMAKGVKGAIDKGIAVVMVSRCFEGRVLATYGYEGGGKELKDMGVIFGEYLPGQKARIKLMIALSYTDNIEDIRKIFEK
ncbi:L-asparaginase [Oxobacter pfennigii]|uniref:L-asparaginase n=1 Tax=Oxobacter pfennigii TaxID=36849 RepID=A0A0P8W3V3_9CLOT|nr:asparaginase [Oxobacter pfennigii]KPU42279.1 L-asparaginase [Oxobacter pfennigii]